MITHSFHAGHLRLACNLFHSIDFDYTCDILRGIPPFNPWMLRELSKVPLKLDPNVPGPFLISQPKISSGITSVRKPDPASFNFRARIMIFNYLYGRAERFKADGMARKKISSVSVSGMGRLKFPFFFSFAP